MLVLESPYISSVIITVVIVSAILLEVLHLVVVVTGIAPSKIELLVTLGPERIVVLGLLWRSLLDGLGHLQAVGDVLLGPLDRLTGLLVVLVPLVSVHDTSIHVGGGVDLRIIKQEEDRSKD